MSDARYPYYRSYLLRFWQESEHSPWRGSLHSVDDGQTLAFGDVESLLLFLLNRAGPATSLSLPPFTDDSSPEGETP